MSNITIEQFKEQVRDRTNLEALAAQSGEIVRDGRLLKMRCPFHTEDTPSCVINEDGSWHCFGACGDGGDCFDWIQKRDGVNFWEAVLILARDAGIEVPQFKPLTPEEEESWAVKLSAGELIQMAADYYQKCLWLPAAQGHRDYLASRGFINQKKWQEWRLGAAGNNNGLLAYLKSKGASIPLAIEVGLINEKDGRQYDFFRDRIIFTLWEGGRCTYLSGRTIGEGEPKYLHLSAAIAKKSAYKLRSRAKVGVVVEGPFDVLALDTLSDRQVAGIALMGLGKGDAAKALHHFRADQIIVGLDADPAGETNIDAIAMAVGPERAKVIAWPIDDPAAWMADGATGEDLRALLDGAPSWLSTQVGVVSAAEDKAGAVIHAVEIAAALEPAYADQFLAEVKAAAGKSITKKTLDLMYRVAKEKQSGQKEGGSASRRNDRADYEVIEGELVRWDGQVVLSGGYAHYVEVVSVDDGENKEIELTLEVVVRGGRVGTSRLKAEDAGRGPDVLSAVMAVGAPYITLNAKMERDLIPAIHTLSKGSAEKVETAHTGWIEPNGELCFVTPGGVVGSLPEGHSVKLPGQFDRIAIADGTDEDFLKGMEGINWLLKSFESDVTFPALAFALLPPASKWIGKGKFMLHLFGETGSGKTSFSLLLSALYGPKLSELPALISWASTTNAVEQLMWWIKDLMGLIDDYKPISVDIKKFTDLVQRYSDGNARQRLRRDLNMQGDHTMRGWLLSTGEWIPEGEASVRARMVMLRFHRRQLGKSWNQEMAEAQKLAPYFSVVMARWVGWLRANAARVDWSGALAKYQKEYGDYIQKIVPDTPNVPRIMSNMAMLNVVWDAFWQFLDESWSEVLNFDLPNADFFTIGKLVATSNAKLVETQTPVEMFLEALQTGLDQGKYRLIAVTSAAKPDGLIGYYDARGIYLLPAAYDQVKENARRMGDQLGYKEREIRERLLEGKLLHPGEGGNLTIVKRVGAPNGAATVRVLHLSPTVLSFNTSEES